MKRSVLIVMGSENDLPKVQPAIAVLDNLDVPLRVSVASAHRSPRRAASLAESAREDGVGVIIAAAGGAHHLGGAMAANTTLPIIALPIAVGTLGGLDSLLSAVQMPGGVPIASVGVDGAKNAGLLAASILSIEDSALADRMSAMRETQLKGVEKSDARVQDKIAKRD
jgi:5-(carboxyamino)imidazole ribonucleotide mutase